MTPSARWPLHPRPRPVEALSSWLARMATANHTTVEDLLRCDLAPAAGLVDVPAPADLNWDPRPCTPNWRSRWRTSSARPTG